jgi:hypothetical protein
MSRALKVFAGALLILVLSASAACPGELRLPFSRYRLPSVTGLTETGDAAETYDRVLAGDEGEEDEAESETGKKIAGAVMFGSGILLCSWGIMDWQTSDTQCCPARNTENVAKIVVGVVLVNAGLVYLIAGGL